LKHTLGLWDTLASRLGEQRLKVTFGVKPGTSNAWLHYYAETIGSLELPSWELREGTL